MARSRPPVPQHLRLRAEHRLVKRMRVDDAVVSLAMEVSQRLRRMEDLGELWEAAHGLLGDPRESPTLQRTGGRMMRVRAQLGECMDVDEEAEVRWPCPAQRTPEDEINARLAEEWLEARLLRLDERTRTIVRNGLGLDGPALSPTEMGARCGVSCERIRQIMAREEEEVRSSWRREMTDAALLLEYGEPEPVADILAIPRKPRPKAEPKRALDAPRRSPLGIGVGNAEGELVVLGTSIRRVDHEKYTLDGGEAVDVDGVAAALLALMGDDADFIGRMRRAIAKRDTAIGDALVWATTGASWPTPVARRVLLPLVTRAPAV